MAYEADRVVVELIAKLDQFDQPIKQSASKFDASMNQISASATKAEASVTQSSAKRVSAIQRESAQISQVTKSLAADMVGAADLISLPFAAPVKQAPAAVSAVRGLGTVVGVLGGVLETVAGVGVALMIAKIIDLVATSHNATSELAQMADKVAENARQAKLAAEAQAIYDRTVQGSLDAMKKLTDEISRQNLTLEDNINLKKASIAIGLQNVVANIGTVSSALATAIQRMHDAQEEVRKFRGAEGDPNAAPEIAAAYSGAQHDFAAAKQQVAELTAELNNLNAAANSGSKALGAVNFPLVERNAKDAVDAVSAINHRFDEADEKAKAAGTYTQAFATNLEKQRKAALDAAKATDTLNKSTGEFGRHIGFDAAAQIAKSAGLTVTSAYRSTEKQAALYNDPSVNKPGNPVAKPGTSAHEGVNGKWALDIAFAPGLSAASLKKLYGDQGVSLSAVYKESGHFHIEGNTGAGRSPVDNSARDAQRAANQETERERAYANEKAGLDDQILDARRQQGLSADETAGIETAAVKIARDRYEQNIAAALKEGKLQKDEYDTLHKGNEDLRKYQNDMVEVRRLQTVAAQKQATDQNTLTVETGLLNAQQEALRSQEGLAKTAAERKTIEDRLIDLQFAEEKIQLERQIQIAADLKALADKTQAQEDIAAAARAEADAAGARAKLNNLPQEQSNAHQQNSQTNASPLQSYFGSIPDTAAELNDAFENIATHGLQNFNDSLTNALVNFTSLRDVGRSVLQGLAADLIKLALQQIELHTIGAALGAASTATTTAAAAAAGAAWAGPAALASLATLGANAGPAAAAIGSTVALATIVGAPKAEGGRIFGPGSDTSDSILTPSSVNEYMIRAQSARKVGYDTLEYINQHGELPVGEGRANGGIIRPTNLPAAQPGAQGGFAPADIRQLESIVSRAVSAMPDVSLYASLDPADMLQKALGRPAGHRALMAHLGNNATAIKATLNRPGT
jgi:hypothetical protein